LLQRSSFLPAQLPSHRSISADAFLRLLSQHRPHPQSRDM